MSAPTMPELWSSEFWDWLAGGDGEQAPRPAGWRAQALTDGQRAGLEVADHLARHGVPVFLGRPALHADGTWNTTGGTGRTGYFFPNGWQHTRARPEVLDEWRPEIAVCAVMGHTVDGADVDPRSGGLDTYKQLVAEDRYPASYGRQTTPSGAFHDLIAPLGVASRDGVLPGLDVKAGTDDGDGRGFVFIAPTMKVSKETGQVGAYRWTRPPDLTDLRDGIADDTGKPLAEMIRRTRKSKATGTSTTSSEAAAVTAFLAPANTHDGRIPVGKRDSTMRDYAFMQANKKMHTRRELLALQEVRWRDCEQPPGDEYPLADALKKVDTALAKVASAASAASSPVGTEPVVLEGDEDEPARTYAFTPGGSFILDTDPAPRPVWGSGEEVLIASGEAMIIAGAQGVGKTSLAQQLALGRCGFPEYTELLGFPVVPGQRRTLYLAMDRPQQAARSFRRMVGEAWRAELDDRLQVWAGPPPYDLARHPALLLRLCEQAGADTVVVDSLKDAAIKLTDDEVGSGYNRARQLAAVNGVEIIELHHNRKAQNGKSAEPTGIDDLYGSTWLPSGAGSVILLVGSPGDPIVGLRHLKQPAAEVGPLKVIHDHSTGRSQVWHAADLVLLAGRPGGITALDAAAALFDTPKPTASDKEKARRRLDQLVSAGSLVMLQRGSTTTNTPTRWASI